MSNSLVFEGEFMARLVYTSEGVRGINSITIRIGLRVEIIATDKSGMKYE